jgi:hypothetical protein
MRDNLFRPFYGRIFLIAVLLGISACHPDDRQVKGITAVVAGVECLPLSSGASLLGVHLAIKSVRRSDEQILSYRFRAGGVDYREALLGTQLRQSLRGRERHLDLSGLPTVIKSKSLVDGWVFFSNNSPGVLRFRLKNTYGAMEALSVGVPSASCNGGTGS